MIGDFTIRGFRGIEKLSMGDLGLINVLVGRNNSSKSSVLEALALLVAATRGVDPLKSTLRQILVWRGWYGPSSIDDMFYGGADSLSVGARMVGDIGDEVDLSLRNGIESDRDSLVAYLELSGGSMPSTKKFRLVVSKEEIASSVSQAVNPESFLPDYGFEFMTPMTFRKYGYVEVLYSRAYEKRVVDTAVDVLRHVYPDIEGLSPLLDGDRWVLHVETLEGVYPYYLMGEGFKGALIVSLLMPLLENGYLFLDTVEAFHHPHSLRTMARTIVRGARENSVQVFMTTHVPRFLEMLTGCEEAEGLEGRIIHMRKERDVEYSIYPLSMGRESLEGIIRDLEG